MRGRPTIGFAFHGRSTWRLVVAMLFLSGFLLPGDAFTNPTEKPAGEAEDISEADPKAAAAKEAELLPKARQLTFEGRRSGEGYFSRDGSQLVFQSEREPGNPFYQIYVMDLETGDVDRVSPGAGKTTCAWIHPTGRRVLFASTQNDPEAKQKQAKEYELRHSGKERRYAWDYDEHFELYDYDRQSGKYKNLTNTRGYDAEGSWSPDGGLIAFTSNRSAYEGELSKKERENFEVDPAYMNDIYLMKSDGSGMKRLTEVAGYDGGPFFSPDGKRICWRRFTPNGAIAEIWTMNIDGTDKRQLTRLGSMSWAPYYHPSGEYLIFTTNQHGFGNFELYLIDAEGKSQPVRVSYTKGFDGLPVFTPDGKRLAWTTNRSKKSQIHIADWNHQGARKLLGLDKLASQETDEARSVAVSARKQSSASFTPQDVMRHVDYLCREELGGRLTGTQGEKLATAYVAAYLDSLGLKPAGDKGGWFQQFEFTAGVALGEGNQLTMGDRPYKLDQDWRPLSFSGTGEFKTAGVVFAGYGMHAAKTQDHEEYDSYVHLDVKDKWVVVFRFMPEEISAEKRQHLSRASQLQFKATAARDRGAKGLIIVSGPTSKAKRQLIPLRLDGILAGSSMPVISVTDRVAEEWLRKNGKSLKQLQTKLDTGAVSMGFELKGVNLASRIAIKRIKKNGRNVLGRLQAGDKPASQVVVVGAHVDHLGRGGGTNSMARDEESNKIHFGADDNASGVAAMLEIAEYLADQKARGKLSMKRDIVFAAWSGEELGLFGSDHFVKTYGHSHHAHHAHDHEHPVAPKATSKAGPKVTTRVVKATAKAPPVKGKNKPPAKPPTKPAALKHNPPAVTHSHGIYPAVAAYVNMDMVGRLNKHLVLQGIGSSSVWRGEIERRNAPVGLSITLQEDSILPTDARSFYMAGVPILSAFTGSHSEYHTPRDTPDTLNYDGAAQVARLMGLVTRSLSLRETPPDFIEQVAKQGPTVGRLRAYLGTVPDYAEEVKGVLLSGARKKGPADKAGVKPGDIIVELAGKKIENIYDYTAAIEALKIGKKVKMVVVRKGKRVTMEITPGSRE